MPTSQRNFSEFPLSPQAVNTLRTAVNEIANPRVIEMLWSVQGSAVPSGTMLSNTTGLTPVWTRAGAGSYNGSVNGSLFIVGKTRLFPLAAPIATTNQSFNFKIVNSQRVCVEINNWAGTFTEQIINDFPISIQIWN